MLKIIGSLMTAVGLFSIGLYKSSVLNKQKDELKMIVKMIEDIEVLTDFENISPKEMFLRLEERSSGEYPNAVYSFNNLQEKCDYPIALKRAVYDSDSHLHGEDKKLLLEFLTSLGKTDSGLQLKCCEKYCTLFRSRLTEAECSCRTDGILYKKLGVLSAAAAVIMFI